MDTGTYRWDRCSAFLALPSLRADWESVVADW